MKKKRLIIITMAVIAIVASYNVYTLHSKIIYLV